MKGALQMSNSGADPDRAFSAVFSDSATLRSQFCNLFSEMEHSGSHVRDGEPRARAYCLNLHSAYCCRHSGACCTAGWAIPVEAPTFETLRVHFGGRFTRDELFTTGGPLPEGAAAILGLRPGGGCVLFDEDHGRLCTVHRELGPALLPVACRQFPRVVLHDARGTLISLSHFCPTVASLLESPAPIEIVEAPETLALEGDVEGLDARGSLPPLLTPGMLADHDGYAAWERRAIGVLARGDLTAARSIDTIAEATQALQSWRPGGPALADQVHRAFDAAEGGHVQEAHGDPAGDERRLQIALDSVPRGVPRQNAFADYRRVWADVLPWWHEVDRPVRAYLAARLFGNWIAYYGRGLHALVEYLRLGLSVLKMEAARHAAVSSSATSPWQTVLAASRSADLLLVHLSDPKELARRLP
jgi:hypothetical protein